MRIPLCTFSFHLGESEIFEGPSGDKYVLSATLFSEHDHERKPLYYYYDSIRADDVVLCFEDNLHDERYSSPYAGIIGKYLEVFRKNYSFSCELLADLRIKIEVYPN